MIDDIIFEDNGLWYFWDETWAYAHGPFMSRDETLDKLEVYALHILGDE